MERLNQKQGIEILKLYIGKKLPRLKWYKKIKPHIKAIIFYGSTAKGLNRPDSDLDMLIFIPLRAEEEHTKGEYVYKFKGREINIVLRSIERLQKLSQKPNNSFESEVFRKCRILYEPDFEVRTLIKQIRAGKH